MFQPIKYRNYVESIQTYSKQVHKIWCLLDCPARPQWSLLFSRPRNSMPNHSPSANFVAPLKRTVPANFWSPTNWCSQCQGGSACSSQQQLVSGSVQVLLGLHEVSWSIRNLGFDSVFSTKANEDVDCLVNKCMPWNLHSPKWMWRSVRENKQTKKKK